MRPSTHVSSGSSSMASLDASTAESAWISTSARSKSTSTLHILDAKARESETIGAAPPAADGRWRETTLCTAGAWRSRRRVRGASSACVSTARKVYNGL